MFKRILCPIDGSDHARKALDLAINLAKSFDAELILLHGLLLNADADELQHFAEVEHLTTSVRTEVARIRAITGRLEYGYEEPPKSSRVYVEIGQSILDGAKSQAKTQGVKTVNTILADADPATQILRCIDERGVDCVVMGSRGLSDMKALFLGSVSHKVLNRAPCTCIAVK
jgi:nucleotide-binding universal stress UspA family protein